MNVIYMVKNEILIFLFNLKCMLVKILRVMIKMRSKMKLNLMCGIIIRFFDDNIFCKNI